MEIKRKLSILQLHSRCRGREGDKEGRVEECEGGGKKWSEGAGGEDFKVVGSTKQVNPRPFEPGEGGVR